MTLADSHVKELLKEGAMKAGTPPSGSDWRIAPDAIAAAKARAEAYIRGLGEEGARSAAGRRQSTLKPEDVQGGGAGAETGPM
ncbi:MAG TPA: hypothetical protein VM889_06330 [Candidatus Thermoplasmatota archaeon]|nr:hypothetical protein [Candidatus Thermoplasmatota archaeon]